MEARLTPTWLIGVWLIDHLSCDPLKMWPPLKIGVGVEGYTSISILCGRT